MHKIKIISQAFIFSAFAFLLALPVLAQPTDILPSSGGWRPADYATTNLPGGTIRGIISNVAMWILGIFGFIGVIGFVIAGIMYLTAAGDAEQEKKAKKAMTMSIIGVIVGLLGLVILYAATLLLGGTNPVF